MIRSASRSPSRSLLRRILPPLVLAVAVVTVVIIGLGFAIMRATLQDRARERADVLVRADQMLIERLPKAGPHVNLPQVIALFGDHPDIAAARLLNPSGVVMVSSHPEEVGELLTDHVSQRSHRGDLITTRDGAPAVHTVRPVPNSPACRSCHTSTAPLVAVLDLDVAVNPHEVGMEAFGGLGMAMGVLYLLSVGATMLFLIRRVVHRPVRRLTRAMARVQDGDLSQEVRHSGTREFDRLVDGFNLMVGRLRRGAHAEREARRLEMERAEQLAVVGELAAGLAHEIRGPVSGVKAAVEVLAADMSVGERGRQILRESAKELGQLDEIVRDLLQYARPHPPEFADADLHAIASDVAKLLTAKASAQGATVRTASTGGLPLVQIDQSQIRQVILNLALNGLQALDGGEGTVTITTSAGDEWATCAVVDTGPGVSLDQAEHVFRPFHTTKGSGTGLGLAISRRIIELHGGRLTLDNPGRPGAAFSFTLPLDRPATGPDEP